MKTTFKNSLVFMATIALNCSGCSRAPSATTDQTQTHAQPKEAPLSIGQDRGNGTDYIRQEDQSAWFTGEGRVIHYCIEVSPGFGLSVEQIAPQVEKAFLAWSDYVKEHGVNTEVTMQGEHMKECTGSVDLKFLFGTVTGEEQKFIGQAGNHLGVAFRTSYDVREGWGQGFIWIAPQGSIPTSERSWEADPIFPNWNAPHTLSAILMHELGHVFGTEHIDQTIMSEYLGNLILRHKLYSDLLVSIDGYKHLYGQLNGSISGQLGLPAVAAKMGWPACDDQVARNFTLLTGRAPVGQVRANLFRKPSEPTDTLILHLEDDREKFAFPLQTYAQETPGSEASGPMKNVFYVAKTYDDTGAVGAITADHKSGVSYVRLTTRTGRVLDVTYEVNLQSLADRGSITLNANGDVLKYFGPNGPVILFASALYKVFERKSGPSDPVRLAGCR
jgi:hypothetical protein